MGDNLCANLTIGITNISNGTIIRGPFEHLHSVVQQDDLDRGNLRVRIVAVLVLKQLDFFPMMDLVFISVRIP